MPRNITRAEFDEACEALWSEIQYQDNLPRRTDDEAKDVPGFATLARVYMAKLDEDWAMNAGSDKALPNLRKLGAIFIRAMVYCGITRR